MAVPRENAVPFFEKVASHCPDWVTRARREQFVAESCSSQIPDLEQEPEMFPEPAVELVEECKHPAVV